MDARLVAERAAAVRARIERAGGTNVGIVAVTKTFAPDAIVAATQAGLTLIGENYAQEAEPKVAAARAQGASFALHFIGHLQTNKVKALARFVDVWETVDRASVVAEIAKRAPGAAVFVQVNATGEETKGGCPIAGVDEVVDAARAAGLRVEGLMTIGPTSGDVSLTRAAFRATRSAAERLGLAQCSMGMTADLEIAVEEGATLVRVGTALFGPRS